MYILSFKPSISKYFGSHDASTVLMKDNLILSIIEEERLTREKHAYNTFPSLSIQKTLEINGISLSDIDVISIPFEPTGWFFTEELSREVVLSDATNIIESELRKFCANEVLPPIKYHNHHLCHAASAFYLSDFDDCLVITADGTGEKEATAIYAAENGKLRKLKQFNWPNSLGILYSTITGFLGFMPNSGEGQTMGLAPYGEVDDRLQKAFAEHVLAIDESGYSLQDERLFRGPLDKRYTLLEEIFGIKKLTKKKRNVIQDEYKNLAFLLQQTIEEIVLKLIADGQQVFPSKKVCLAGGLAMNVSLNGKILDSGIVDDIFVQPLAGDNGCMIGAAILEQLERSGTCDFLPMRHLYYGPEYSNEYIETFLQQQGVAFSFIEKPWKKAAQLVAEGKIVGWFNGRMEAGARALGNRSLISNPCKHEYKDMVNDFKDRERWRPLALSILDEYKHDYLSGKIPLCASFMIITRHVHKDKIDRIPAAVHIDGTTRPQIVSQETNPQYHQLIKEFYDLTGVPLVMNTSMNGRGEPIVEHPEQALNFFKQSGIDAMFLQNYMLIK